MQTPDAALHLSVNTLHKERTWRWEGRGGGGEGGGGGSGHSEIVYQTGG